MTNAITLNNADIHRALVIISRTQNAFETGMLTASIRNLKNEMSKRIVKLTFRKQDGSITTRFATTLPQLTENFIYGSGTCGDARNVVVFYDLCATTANKWRSFRYENFICYE